MNKFYFAKTKLLLVPAAIILIALAISTTAAQTITTFDAPGAGTGPFQGTRSLNVDPSGTIIGFSVDANNVRHGFVRSPDGSFTIFDAPGAGTAAGQGTRAYSINPSGTITGFFNDAVNVFHGYVRSSLGLITGFDAPGAGTGPFQGTFPFSPLIMNPNGAITGWATDSAFVSHGFLRDRNGGFTAFDAPGAGTGAGQGTFPFAISLGGAITGFYTDGTNANHGFLRDQRGAITTFDAPDAGNVPGSFQGTFPFGINTSGAITGWYTDDANVNHGFVRDRHGALVEFDVPGAGTGPGQGPNVYSIAPNGAVTGFFLDPDNVVHGFVREADRGALSLLKSRG